MKRRAKSSDLVAETNRLDPGFRRNDGGGILRALVLLSLTLATTARAAPLSREAVPEPLRPWTEWVLRGHEAQLCPRLYGNADARQCAWPSQLTIDIDEKGGHFSQQWMTARAEWVPLPGNSGAWPQDVTIDGKPASVANDPDAENVDGAGPRLYLDAGQHSVGGRFEWSKLPEMLHIPSETGLLTLFVNEQPVLFPNRDAEGHLWLQRKTAEEQTETRLDVAVNRLVIDDVPLQLVTRIELIASGPGREVLLGRALPEGFIPMALDTPLPARLEADNRLRVQVRTGRWQLELRARHLGPAESIALPQLDGQWDAEEAWAFQAQPQLRVVTVEGVDAIDPQQTELPAEWRQFPAYLMKPETAMRIVEQRRGDAEPAADELNLSRTWWLDFDGGGYTVHDQINGTLRRSWRLDMLPPTELGRVAVAGTDQFITRVDQRVGVEVRPPLTSPPPSGGDNRGGTFQLDADARISGDTRRIAAVGWDVDFNSVSGTLNLPPGWRLLHATGVDVAAPTWVTSWTLFDFFIVLLIVLAFARLFGMPWGAMALLTLGLTFNEPHAPQWSWLAVLVAEALARTLPAGRLAQVVRLGRIVAVVVLVVFAVPFLLQQARQALYPALEYPWLATEVPHVLTAGSPAPERLGNLGSRADALRQQPGGAEDAMLMRKAALGSASESYSEQRYQNLIDPKAVVQTGPGLPTWTWNQVSLSWQGPVERTQAIHLYLVPPWGSIALAVARVLLVALLLVLLARCLRVALPTVRTAIVLLALIPCARAALGSEVPRKDILDELRNALLQPPECHPHCASIPRLHLEVLPDALRARLTINAAADGAVPLPGQASQWLPSTVVVDEHPASAVSRADDGTLWLYVTAGIHQVILSGALPEHDVVQLALPLRPQRVTAEANGWEIAGLHDDGIADDSLQLTRLATQEGARSELKPGALPAFVSVERTIRLPVSWRVETRVVRLTPPGTAVVLDVPLLAGESVTTAGIRVVDGKVQLNMAPQASSIEWESTLAEVSPIRLQAPTVSTWVETWTLDASPIWHVETDGIPPVHPDEHRARQWRPWPGESVTFIVTRPEGVPGQTLTIDRASIEVSPGIRSTDVRAMVDVRSNRGTQHSMTLPDQAQLQTISINGVEQPNRQEGRQVTVPITPGHQTVALTWRQNSGIQRQFVTPDIGLGAPSVNVDIRIPFPADRWILYVRGPRLGPAILFWSTLGVLLLLALALGRISFTPLRAHHWFLLGVGLTQVPVQAAAVVVGWVLILGVRRRDPITARAFAFDLFQIVLVIWTIAAMAMLLWAIQQGLLGLPQMQIAGNGSSASELRWYQDRAAPQLPHAAVFSVPLLAYRLLMLAWALWIAQALLGWLRWAWECFSSGGYWRRVAWR